MPYRIERSLRRAELEVGKPLCAKYQVLKDRLFTQEYAHWATKFPGGNDHGPGHIERVLEKFEQLIDGNPARRPVLRPYELFLAMLSILYHDIGMLGGREGHADISALLVGDEHNDYLIDARDREVIRAAVVSHSGSKDIAEQTAGFADDELIGGQSVRPRLIAALVRLADELDEDFRRADPDLQSRLNVPEESRFFWEFCQHISGIKPDLAAHVINIDVRFTADDMGRNVVVNGRLMPFIVAFGDKLAKINRERVTVNFFLPEQVRYRYLKLSVKPLPGHKGWKHPREFVFGEYTSGSEFVAAFPEFLAKPASGWLRDSLRLIRAGDLDQATVALNRMGEVAEYLPYSLRLRYFYDAACLASLKADLAKPPGGERAQLLQSSLDHLFCWLDLLLDETGPVDEADSDRVEFLDSYNEIYKMARDNDLYFLLSKHRKTIKRRLPKDLRLAVVPDYPVVPDDLSLRDSGGSTTGCFLKGARVSTPTGPVPIENIRENDTILSVDLGPCPAIIHTSVVRVHTLREARCIRLDDRRLLTPSQPVCGPGGRFIAAGELAAGSSVLTSSLDYEPIRSASVIDGYFEVYTLTTGHPSHNFIAEDLVCHNKMYPEEDEHPILQ
jgi:hypothetical protein